MPTAREALDGLYASVGTSTTVSMRQFLSDYSSNSAAAQALAGTSNRQSHEYKAAIRDVQRYQNYINGTGRQARNPDNVRVATLRRASQAEARREVRRRGITVKQYRGKVKTSPKRRRRGREGQFETNDANRMRSIRNVTIPPSQIDSDVLDGDTRAFSDAFLDAYGAGAIGELYDIDELELELGDEGDDEEPDDE